MWKPKTVYAYVDGERVCDVVDEALRLKLTLTDMKKEIEMQYACHKVEFKVESVRKDV